MAKSLSGLWLRSLRSITKTQRAQTRLMKSLLPQPDFAAATRMNQLAERKGFAVLSPARITPAESRNWCSATSARWATPGAAATTASASVHAKGRTHR